MFSELRYALRSLRKAPAFTGVAIITLALGIGANTALFSVLKAVLLERLPYRDPDRLVVLSERNSRGDSPVAYPVYQDWARQNEVFESMAAYRPHEFIVSGDAQAERVPGKKVSSAFFSTFGAAPVLGRDLAPEEDKPGAPRVALLSYGFWQRRFAGDRTVIGRAVTLDGEPHVIVGVLPPGFRFWGDASVYTALAPEAHREARYDHNATWVVARMRPGVSLAEARAQMDTISRRLAQEYPKDNAGESASVAPMREVQVGRYRQTLLVLFGAVAFVLLIACVNVANLALARATDRVRDFGLRSALGAGRWAGMRPVLLESMLLAVAGGACGALLAAGMVNSLRSIAPEDLSARGFPIDGGVLAFTMALACLTGILFGIAPALRLSSTKLNEVLKEGGRVSGERQAQGRLRDLLVAGEVALALVLLIGAGLLIRTATRLTAVDPGFDTRNVVTMRALPPFSRLTKAAMAGGNLNVDLLIRGFGAYEARMLESVRGLPGIDAIATGFPIPVAGETCQIPIAPEGRPEPAPNDAPAAHYYVVSPDYFRTMGISFVKGRLFSAGDNADAPRVAIISETMARSFWPGEDPIGRRFHFPGVTEMPDRFTVIGIVRDTKHAGLTTPAPPQAYFCFLQWPQTMFIVARTARDPMQAAATIRRALGSYDRDLALYDVRTMEQRVSETGGYRRAVTALLSIFAALALALTAVGIYGVVSYSTGRRGHEIGVRLALGARPADVLRMVLGKAALVAGSGVLAGVLGALALTRLLKNLLFGVVATDPWTFGAIAALLCVIALGAAWLPARRAAGTDPARALRCE